MRPAFLAFVFLTLIAALAFKSKRPPTPISCYASSLFVKKPQNSPVPSKVCKQLRHMLANLFLIIFSATNVVADDELAKYAAQGNSVDVDTLCFFKKCALETAKCANNPSCLKGLSCLARCKGGSMCSTGCFAKYGSPQLDNVLACTVEKNDCVHVPGKEVVGWNIDDPSSLPSAPLKSFDIASMRGVWYKVLGLDSRYDCFDCQKNSFELKSSDTLGMDALFRIPRQTYPGYLQNRITEELHLVKHSEKEGDMTVASAANMQSKGEMFGLTFWENWYILGDSMDLLVSKDSSIPKPSDWGKEFPDMKLVYYTGHTLQGSYRGAFVYSKLPELVPETRAVAAALIKRAGLNPRDFCIVRNACFAEEARSAAKLMREKKSAGTYDYRYRARKESDGPDVAGTSKNEESSRDNNRGTPYWFLGQNFFRVTASVARELADWFEDPELLSDWLVNQQQHMMLQEPLAVSPFASLVQEETR